MQTKDSEPKYFICSLATQAVRKMVAHYNRALAPMGLTAQQAMALGVLWREDGLSLGVFARRAGMGKAAAVTMIKRLELMELVIKKTDPHDARLNVIKLTGKALKQAPELLSMGKALEKSIEEVVGTKDMDSLIKGLSLIRDLDF
jgi:DNA-binding MarR family transcriptional regulator